VFTLMYVSDIYCKPKQNLRKDRKIALAILAFFHSLFIYSLFAMYLMAVEVTESIVTLYTYCRVYE
jgi:hypothetical protein